MRCAKYARISACRYATRILEIALGEIIACGLCAWKRAHFDNENPLLTTLLPLRVLKYFLFLILFIICSLLRSVSVKCRRYNVP